MVNKEKIEHLKYTINRFDHYYDSVNNKGNVFLALNTFLLGGVIAGYYSMRNDTIVTPCVSALVLLAILANLGSITTALFAIKPYLNSCKTAKEGSTLYFGDISTYSGEEMKVKIASTTEEVLLTDLSNQSRMLSIGLYGKFELMLWSTYFLCGQIVLITLISLILLNNK